MKKSGEEDRGGPVVFIEVFAAETSQEGSN